MLIHSQDEAYKRGLVLGLTMAEIMILVLFTLLLLLGSILKRHMDTIEEQAARIEEQAARLESYEEIIHQLTEGTSATPEDLELVAALKEYWERHAPEDVNPKDYFSQLVLQVEELEKLRAELEELVEKRREMEAQAVEAEALSQRVEELTGALDDVLEQLADKEYEIASAAEEVQGLKDEVEQLDDALDVALEQLSEAAGEKEKLIEQAQALEGLGLDLAKEEDQQTLKQVVSLMRQASADGTNFEEMSNMISTLEGEIGNMKKLIAFYERRFGYPPCWHDGDFRIDFTFDVKLTSSGYVLRRIEHARHADHPVMPNVLNVSTGREIPTSAFVEQTRPIFDWSVANECRFYATVYDGTAENEKRIYQDRMRTLEGHFYKLERVNEPAPF